ncbi:MAG TPA: hypothetical protein VGI57_04290 [Usitatibacter sp.]
MRITGLLALAALAGCATVTNYQLTAMPRDSGKLYSGTAVDNGSIEGPVSIVIEDKTYKGTWVQTRPSQTSGYVSGGYGGGPGWHGGGWYGAGGFISMDNPAGGAAKALLTAPDGTGLRCDFKSGQGSGGGECRDDAGRTYDVQIRSTR